MALSKTGEVTLHGINYKDDPDNASNWLARYGNPYERTGADRNGRVGIDWGVYGVPETFVIDQSGRIRYKHVGVMTQDILDKNILPLVRQLKAGK
jgi:cytochrome c biogenesis protein CcmG/thiol:disulfide interchange protein DsbE